MWPFLAFALVLLFLVFKLIQLARKDWNGETVAAAVVVLLGLGVILFFISAWLSALTTGLYPGYSVGQREGYVTKISQKGLLWKTWEIEMQVGTGEMAALQAPHKLSVTEDVIRHVQDNFGGRVRVKYRQWLIMPFSVGDTNQEVTGIEMVK